MAKDFCRPPQANHWKLRLTSRHEGSWLHKFASRDWWRYTLMNLSQLKECITYMHPVKYIMSLMQHLLRMCASKGDIEIHSSTLNNVWTSVLVTIIIKQKNGINYRRNNNVWVQVQEILLERMDAAMPEKPSVFYGDPRRTWPEAKCHTYFIKHHDTIVLMPIAVEYDMWVFMISEAAQRRQELEKANWKNLSSRSSQTRIISKRTDLRQKS